LKFFNFGLNPFYKITTIPGRKEGISSSLILGNNVSASIYSSKEKQEAAIKVIEFITSKENIKELSLRNNVLTGISSIYDDEEVCKVMDCELFKSIQPIVRPTKENENYDEYSMKLRYYVYDFVYGDKSAKEVLKEIIDLRKIYSISLDTKETSIGVIFFCLLCVIICIMILSLIFLFIPSFKPFFTFLPNDFWILSILGIIMIFCISFTEMGDITVFKCHLRIILLTIGFSLNMVTFLYKLIITFPEENKISKWIEQHRYLFLLSFIIIDLIMNGLLLIQPYEIKNIEGNGEHFNICELRNTYSVIIGYIFIFFKFIVFISIILLIFLEWNMKSIMIDLRFFISTIYIDALSFLLVLIMDIFNINNYIGYFIINTIIYIVYNISNYIFMFGFRIIFFFVNKVVGDKEEGINTIIINLKNGIDASGNTTTEINKKSRISTNTNNSSKNNRHSNAVMLYQKMLNYHDREEVSNSNSNSLTNSKISKSDNSNSI